MQLARVIGRATSTRKHPSLDGWRLLVCETLSNSGEPTGDPILSVDALGAGAGDTVIVSSDGRGLRELLKAPDSPARWWTLGIVDE